MCKLCTVKCRFHWVNCLSVYVLSSLFMRCMYSRWSPCYRPALYCIIGERWKREMYRSFIFGVLNRRCLIFCVNCATIGLAERHQSSRSAFTSLSFVHSFNFIAILPSVHLPSYVWQFKLVIADMISWLLTWKSFGAFYSDGLFFLLD